MSTSLGAAVSGKVIDMCEHLTQTHSRQMFIMLWSLINSLVYKFLLLFCVCAYVHASTLVPQLTHRGQIQSSPFPWLLGIKLRLLGLAVSKEEGWYLNSNICQPVGQREPMMGKKWTKEPDNSQAVGCHENIYSICVSSSGHCYKLNNKVERLSWPMETWAVEFLNLHVSYKTTKILFSAAYLIWWRWKTWVNDLNKLEQSWQTEIFINLTFFHDLE